MDELQIERIRTIRAQILLELYGAHPLKLGVLALHRRLRRAQFDFTPDEIDRQALFLCGQQLACDVVDPTTGTPLYGITSRGMIEYETRR